MANGFKKKKKLLYGSKTCKIIILLKSRFLTLTIKNKSLIFISLDIEFENGRLKCQFNSQTSFSCQSVKPSRSSKQQAAKQ